MDVLRIFAVDFERLRAVPGSLDAELLHELQGRLLDEVDPREDEEDEDATITALEAFERILRGTVSPDDPGEPYRAAMALLYLHLGRLLGALEFSSGQLGHLETVDAALKVAGAGPSLSIMSLAFGGVPFDVPDA